MILINLKIPNNHHYLDINHDATPLSSIPVPLTDEAPISDWNKEWCSYEYRPTPPIDDELFANARVIHGITSVQNRSNIKRNQQFIDKYKEHQNHFDEISLKTSYDIFVTIEDSPPQAAADKPVEQTDQAELPATEATSQVEEEKT